MRELLDAAGLAAEIEVDGGVSAETAGGCVAAGARMLVAGSAIFAAPDGVAAATARIRAAVSEVLRGA